MSRALTAASRVQRLLTELHAAKRARDAHEQTGQCWTYEGAGECQECRWAHAYVEACREAYKAAADHEGAVSL